jgi:lysophospholipase L1-like esterase
MRILTKLLLIVAMLGLMAGTTITGTVVTLSGVAGAAATVKVFDGTAQIGTATADGTGAWTYTTEAAVTGSHSYTATETDAAGADTKVAVAVSSAAVDHTPPPVVPPQLVLQGDSLTAGLFLNSKNDVWAYKLGKTVLVNYAVSATGFTVSSRYGASITTRGPEADKWRTSTRALMVLGGTNDFCIGYKTADQVNTGFDGWIAARKAAGWEYAQIWVLTLPARTGCGTIGITEFNNRRTAFTAHLVQKAAELGFHVVRVDLNATVGTPNTVAKNRTYFNYDGVHLTSAGQTVISTVVKAAGG